MFSSDAFKALQACMKKISAVCKGNTLYEITEQSLQNLKGICIGDGTGMINILSHFVSTTLCYVYYCWNMCFSFIYIKTFYSKIDTWGENNKVRARERSSKSPIPETQILASDRERSLCWTRLWIEDNKHRYCKSYASWHNWNLQYSVCYNQLQW